MPSRELLAWLTCVDFLTKKLYDRSGHTHLVVLDQSWGMANWWDRYVLNLDFGQVMHREIVTLAWDDPCWYARTIIPVAMYQAQHRLFDRLNTETLGALIFEGTQLQRIALVYYPIDKRAIEYHWLTEAMHREAETLWVRRSTFRLADLPVPDDVVVSHAEFYLVEVLLPGLEKYIC